MNRRSTSTRWALLGLALLVLGQAGVEAGDTAVIEGRILDDAGNPVPEYTVVRLFRKVLRKKLLPIKIHSRVDICPVTK